ncbi:MAG: DUF389 domain-containing protein [Bacteroidales bacterium]|nr:DUF389 domain-containing protein [Bacteroidales bacterium]
MNENNNKRSLLARYLNPRVGLANDLDVEAAATSIKNNIPFRGPNVYILAFAIIIASVGLNVNSIPVIIGAMLVSPLMGPIVGLGLALGTNDLKLFRYALKNLGVMGGISIAASAIYFFLTPLNLENPTELLARTNPTIYDVLIAFFGGLAGILETSRKERGTVISGVAIATALMPPLCTIGYGIAQLNLHYAMGALYLFFINSAFIALAAFLGVKYLGFSQASFADEKQRKRISRTISIILIIIIIPSIFSAISIVRQNNFDRNVAAFVSSAKRMDANLIYEYKVSHESNHSSVELYLTSSELDATTRESLYSLAEEHHLLRGQLAFNTSTLGGLRSDDVVKDLYERSANSLQQRDSLIASLREEINQYRNADKEYPQLASEIRTQYPAISDVSITKGLSMPKQAAQHDQTVVIVKSDAPLSPADMERLESWLKVRMKTEQLKIYNI